MDFYLKMMNVVDIENYLNIEEPTLADDGANPISADAKGNTAKQSCRFE